MVHSNLPCWLKWMCGDPRKKATAQPDPHQHLLVALTWAGRHRAPAAHLCLSPRSTPLFSGKAGGHRLLHCTWESGPLSWFSPGQLSLRAWGKLETTRKDDALTERCGVCETPCRVLGWSAESGECSRLSRALPLSLHSLTH